LRLTGDANHNNMQFKLSNVGTSNTDTGQFTGILNSIAITYHEEDFRVVILESVEDIHRSTLYKIAAATMPSCCLFGEDDCLTAGALVLASGPHRRGIVRKYFLSCYRTRSKT
jgi:hypothetical protein